MNLLRPARLSSKFVSHPWLCAALRASSYPVRYWNWKAAILQISIRCSVYFFVAIHHGHHGSQDGLHAAWISAVWIEAVYVCLSAGFFSALQQGAMRLDPRWLADAVIIAVVPVFAQVIDSLVQYAAGTANVRETSIGMVCWGLLSAAFHLHLMRNGAMLVGDGSHSFADDLRRIPRLVAGFVAAPFVAGLALVRSRDAASESEAAA